VRQTAQQFDVPLVDIEHSFREKSPSGVPGHNLLHEHVHPNINGYLLFAQSIAQALDESDILPDQRFWSAVKSDSAYIAQTGMTTLDHEVVNYTLYRLLAQWPFPVPQSMPPYQRIGSEKTEALAIECIDGGEKSLVELHLAYGQELHEHGRLDEALLEYKAALAIQPLSVTFNRIGRIYLRQTEEAFRDQKDYAAALSHFQNGVHYFKTGLQRWPDEVELHFNLGLLYFMRQDKITAAIEQFQKVLELEPNHKIAHRQLAELYIRQQEYQKAKTLLQKAVSLFPNEARFCTDLGLIFLQEQNLDKARSWLNKAIQLNNDPKARYFLNQIDGTSN
jgi:tetratricopeptide (TPR) repeat protein